VASATTGLFWAAAPAQRPPLRRRTYISRPSHASRPAACPLQVLFCHGGQLFEISPLRTRREAELAADVLTREGVGKGLLHSVPVVHAPSSSLQSP